MPEPSKEVKTSVCAPCAACFFYQEEQDDLDGTVYALCYVYPSPRSLAPTRAVPCTLFHRREPDLREDARMLALDKLVPIGPVPDVRTTKDFGALRKLSPEDRKAIFDAATKCSDAILRGAPPPSGFAYEKCSNCDHGRVRAGCSAGYIVCALDSDTYRAADAGCTNWRPEQEPKT